jgi:hypothetical protein
VTGSEATGVGLSRRHLLAIGGAGAAGTLASVMASEERAVAAVLAARDYGVRADGSSDDTAAMNAAIRDLNAAPRQELVLPEGIIQITAELDPITADDAVIRGAGPGPTLIRFPASAGDAGTFFKLGTAASLAARVTIANLRLHCLNAPSPNKPAFLIENANDLRVRDIAVEQISALTKIGTDANACARCWFYNVVGSFNAAQGGKVIHVHNAKNVRCVDVQITSSAAGPAGGASIYVAPVAAGSFIDTAYFIRCQIWSSGVTDYGVYLDASQQKIVWLWFLDCVFDEHRIDCFRIASTGKEVRNVLVRGTLLGATSQPGSNCVDISHSGTDPNTDVLTGVSFEDCLMAYRAGAAVVASGSTVRDLKFYFNRVQDSTVTAKNAAFSFRCGNWTAIGNRFYRYAGASGTAHAIETTADVDDFIAIGNLASHLSTDFFSHFAYSSPSPNRIVRDNIGGSAESGGSTAAGEPGGTDGSADTTDGSADTYRTRSLSANKDYVPDQTRRTHVIVTPKLTVPAGAHGAVRIQVGKPGATAELARVEFDNDDQRSRPAQPRRNKKRRGHKVVIREPVSFVVPPGQAYRLTTRNVSGSSGFELGVAQELPL